MKLSIAIFGNTNNSQLLLAQGLQQLGHNVRLILNRKEALHRPESIYPQWRGAYPDWIMDCSDVTDEDIAFQTQALDRIIHQLTFGVDLAILNDTGPAIAAHLKSPHVAYLTGSDLAYWANFEMLTHRTVTWDLNFKRSLEGRRYVMKFTELVGRQRDGILGAELVCYPLRGLIPSGDALLDQIGVADSRRFMFFIANLQDLARQESAKIDKRLTLLNGSRIVFRPDLHPDMSAIDFKGTDVLLRGFAQFIKRGGKAELRMVRKGQDVAEAMDLIRQLGIDSAITWLDEMSLAQFHQEIIATHLICDQFGTSYPGGVTLDAYALGRPVLSNLRRDKFVHRFPEPLPGFDASTAEEIAEHLALIDKKPELLAKVGDDGRTYAERFLSQKEMARQMLGRLGIVEHPSS